MSNQKEQHEKLMALIKAAISQDQSIREKYQVGDKFRFIRDRLQSLLTHLESTALTYIEKEKTVSAQSATEEVLVYVYLFNTQGLDLRSWVKMLTARGLYEYSVNRPIYLDRAHADAMIRFKKNKTQQGYLIVSVKKEHILQADFGKDAIGQPLAKIKEGALLLEQMVSFFHNDHVYVLNKAGELVVKA